MVAPTPPVYLSPFLTHQEAEVLPPHLRDSGPCIKPLQGFSESHLPKNPAASQKGQLRWKPKLHLSSVALPFPFAAL